MPDTVYNFPIQDYAHPDDNAPPTSYCNLLTFFSCKS